MRDKTFELISLLEDLKAHFSHELILMEGNFGLTGDEDRAEMEASGEIREWHEIRASRALLARIEAQMTGEAAAVPA
jgi:hypothetical protein